MKSALRLQCNGIVNREERREKREVRIASINLRDLVSPLFLKRGWGEVIKERKIIKSFYPLDNHAGIVTPLFLRRGDGGEVFRE